MRKQTLDELARVEKYSSAMVEVSGISEPKVHVLVDFEGDVTNLAGVGFFLRRLIPLLPV
jgi:hypothetical protein